jgi:hypothetical protein
MSCFSIRASRGGALLVGCSTCTDSRAGAPICPVCLALQLDRAKIRVEVECDLMKRSHTLSSWAR